MRRLLAVLMVLIPLTCAHTVHAGYMSPMSDLISTSKPSTAASHIFIFKVTNSIPASGSITITPENAFSIPVGFGFSDVDLAVSSGGPYAERNLAASASAASDGVFAVSGSTGSITITLNSSSGIAAGSMVRIVLGTAASHQTAGSMSPINPVSAGSYRIRIDTANGPSHIDDAKAMIAIVQPVTTELVVPYLAPIISNGYPSGQLPAGSALVELSIQTDKPSRCRYSTTPGVDYDDMTNTFSNIGNLVFYTVVSGHIDGGSYAYYVRCSDFGNLVNLDDYIISFSLATTPTVTSSDGNTPSGGSATGGSGGSGGSGPFAGGSALLFLSNVTLSGKAPPGTTVTVLRDGKAALTIPAGADGSFSGKVTGLERGTYTFVTYATDKDGNKTARFSSTITFGSGTSNFISSIMLSPTVSVAKTIPIGDDVPVSGLAIPNSIVKLSVRDVPKTGVGTPKEYTASSTAEGTWTITLPAKGFSRGTYDFRAKSVMPESSSEYSAPSYMGYGEDPSQKADTGNRSDINKDGKVNLVDFSILLTHWNEADDDADINQDGIVNLSDFSILLFNWTG